VKNYYQPILKTPIRSEASKCRGLRLSATTTPACWVVSRTVSTWSPSTPATRRSFTSTLTTFWHPYEDAEDIQERILGDLLRGKKELFQQVTPDPKRAPYSRATFSAMHHEKRFIGAGPRGHGLPKDGRLYYTFPISDKVMALRWTPPSRRAAPMGTWVANKWRG